MEIAQRIISDARPAPSVAQQNHVADGTRPALRREDLIPLGSRIRTRLATEHASREELIEGLSHLLTGAGNATLMTQQLRHTLCDHAAGNYRILTTMAAELLAVAAKRELPQLDEKLYLEVFAQPDTSTPRRAGSRR